jgi:hypothetical protein
MKRNGWLLIALAALLVALVPLAYANAPDAKWIPGIFDGDVDDVVTLDPGSVDTSPRGDVCPPPLAFKPLSPIPQHALSSSSPSSSSTRGPPAV